MAQDKKIICPLMGGKPCIEDGSIVDGELHACRFWVHVIGKDPQTGNDIDNADCAFAWQPMLMIENSNVNRQTGAAVESMRNENVTTGEQITSALMQVANVNNQHLIKG